MTKAWPGSIDAPAYVRIKGRSPYRLPYRDCFYFYYRGFAICLYRNLWIIPMQGRITFTARVSPTRLRGAAHGSSPIYRTVVSVRSH